MRANPILHVLGHRGRAFAPKEKLSMSARSIVRGFVASAAGVALIAGAVSYVPAQAASAGTLTVGPSSGLSQTVSTFTTSGQCPLGETVTVKVFGGSGTGATIAEPATRFSPKNINGAVLADGLRNASNGMTIPASQMWTDFATQGSPALTTLNGVYTVRAWCSGDTWFDGTVTFYGSSLATAQFIAGSVTTPGAPQNLVATPAAGSVGLSWDAPSSDGGSAVTGYTVTRELASGGAGLVSCSVVGLTATCPTLTNGTNYSFRVAATNVIGTGTEASTTSTPRTVPGAPRSVTATAGNARATVSWLAPLSTGGSAITGYTVTASPKVGTATRTCTTTGARSCVVTGLTNGVSYRFTVKARNVAGTGAASAASAATAPYAPITVAWTKAARTITAKFSPVSGATSYALVSTGATSGTKACTVAGTGSNRKVTCTITLKAGKSTLTVQAKKGTLIIAKATRVWTV